MNSLHTFAFNPFEHLCEVADIFVMEGRVKGRRAKPLLDLVTRSTGRSFRHFSELAFFKELEAAVETCRALPLATDEQAQRHERQTFWKLLSAADELIKEICFPEAGYQTPSAGLLHGDGIEKCHPGPELMALRQAADVYAEALGCNMKSPSPGLPPRKLPPPFP